MATPSTPPRRETRGTGSRRPGPRVPGLTLAAALALLLTAGPAARGGDPGSADPRLPLVGLYADEDGTEVLVLRHAGGGLRLGLPASRDYPVVAATDEPDAFADDAGGRVRFERGADGAVTGLELLGLAGHALSATQDDAVAVVPVRFASEGVTLDGRVLLPRRDHPVPGVVFTHGSGSDPIDGEYDLFHAWPLVERGMAVLLYDKRGVGDSGGDWLDAGFEDLADDALAGVALLGERTEVDAGAVALWGQSQSASWVVPVAAARGDEVAAIVCLSGMVGSASEQEAYNQRGKLQRAGFTPEQVETAMAWSAGTEALLRDGAPFAALATRWDALAGEPWSDLMPPRPEGPDEPGLRYWRGVMDFDNQPAWAALRCPALVVYGQDDPLVDVPLSLRRLDAALGRSGNHDVTLKVYPSPAGHVIGPSSTPGFLELEASWLEEHLAAH